MSAIFARGPAALKGIAIPDTPVGKGGLGGGEWGPGSLSHRSQGGNIPSGGDHCGHHNQLSNPKSNHQIGCRERSGMEIRVERKLPFRGSGGQRCRKFDSPTWRELVHDHLGIWYKCTTSKPLMRCYGTMMCVNEGTK